MAEAFYTVVSFYQMTKREAAHALLALLDRKGVEVREKDVVAQVLRVVGRGRLSFVDTYLVFSAKEPSGREGMATLDKGLAKEAKR